MRDRMDQERQRDRWRWDEDGRPGFGGPGELGRGEDDEPGRTSYGAYVASGRGGGSAGLPRREPWLRGDDDLPAYGSYGYGPMDHEIGRGQGFAPSQWAGYRGRGQRQELPDAWDRGRPEPWAGPGERPWSRGMDGPYRGLGPRGYRRTDDRIREDVCELLTESGTVDASDIDVSVRDGIVTLAGSVPDRATKRIAEDLAERCRGVVDVRNELSLVSGPGAPVMDERPRSSVGSSVGAGSGATTGSQSGSTRGN